MNQLIENVEHLPQQVVLGQEGLVGPFSMPLDLNEAQARSVDYYAIYLGEIGSQLPTFLALAHDKTAEMRLKRMTRASA